MMKNPQPRISMLSLDDMIMTTVRLVEMLKKLRQNSVALVDNKFLFCFQNRELVAVSNFEDKIQSHVSQFTGKPAL